MAKILGLILLLAASPAFAALTCTTNVNPQGTLGGDASSYMTGCLKEPTGLIDNPGTSAWNNAYIAWNITPLPTGDGFLYEYTWSAVTKDVSHIILGLSSDCTATSRCLWDLSWTQVEYNTWGPSGPGSSNPGFPSGADFWGIKFDNLPNATTFDFSFKSNRVPVWQNFYAKDGTDSNTDVYAYNAGLGQTGLSYYVAAPDTVIPEPGFYGLLALGLAGLYMAARRRSIAK